MGKILCIETATTNCSVALGENGGLVSLREDYNNKYSHAEKLHVYIKELLEEKGWGISDLDAVAVSKGPGSYTGLRIGVSAAKGLCFAHDLPLISIPTLTSLASQIKEEALDYIVAMLDARRMEVYTAGFSSKMEEVFGTKAEILNESSFSDLLNRGKVGFIGNGVAKFKEICSHDNATFIEDKLPSSKEMIALAEEKFQRGTFEDVAYFEPYYLKDFMAG